MKSAHDLSTAPSEPARTRLGISDLPYSLDTAKMARIERAVRLCPLTVADRTRPGFTRADWRDLMRTVVIRLFPTPISMLEEATSRSMPHRLLSLP